MKRLAVLLLLASACAPFHKGPFVDGDAFCDGLDGGPVGDPACPDGTHCQFPAPGWRPRCMEGPSSVDDVPTDIAERRAADGGR